MSVVEVFECPVCPEAGARIRSLLIKGEPWFVAVDACRALGIGNTGMAIRRLDADAVSSADTIDRLGRARRVRIVDEAGLYALAFQSRKPEAQAFTRWVTREVLPQIRRTGAYVVPGRTSWSGLRDVESGASVPWEQAEGIARANGLPLGHGTLRELLTTAGFLTLTGRPHKTHEYLFRLMPSGTRTEVWAATLETVLLIAHNEIQRRLALAGVEQLELPVDGRRLVLVEESA
ncbi:BRO-N domain-containing protein [Streptomyces sp. BH106]|uniref:BRO-N domain-containing protein n=1 Tax=Streptomyces sp. BH106 TaxID=3410409 RepID=UPI003CF66B5E